MNGDRKIVNRQYYPEEYWEQYDMRKVNDLYKIIYVYVYNYIYLDIEEGIVKQNANRQQPISRSTLYEVDNNSNFSGSRISSNGGKAGGLLINQLNASTFFTNSDTPFFLFITFCLLRLTNQQYSFLLAVWFNLHCAEHVEVKHCKHTFHF